jgi:hypothetical protein
MPRPFTLFESDAISTNGTNGHATSSIPTEEIVSKPSQIEESPESLGTEETVSKTEIALPVIPATDYERSKQEHEKTGLHDILTSCEIGFGYGLSSLEKFAIGLAQDHARAGLPRQDVPSNEELEPEQVLRARAAELFVEWVSKVRRKVQDQIQVAAVRVGDALVELRHTIDQLELATWNIKEAERLRRALDDPLAGVQTKVEHRRLLSNAVFWPMFIILSLVDWIANVPIFMQLLPHDPYADARSLAFAQGAERFGMWDGMHILAHRLTSSPEVSVLALGLVVILMFLCHSCGASLRKLMAYRRKDQPKIEMEISSHRRQAWIPFGLTLLALMGAILFLLIARTRIEQVTASQVAAAKEVLRKASDKLNGDTARNDLDQIQNDSDAKEDAQSQLDAAQNTYNYAAGIKGMNSALGILNLVLVAAATTMSYLHDKGNITELASEAPRALTLDAQLDGLRREAVALRARIRTLYATAEEGIAQAKYLGQSSPLREWTAKALRLNAVVPLFRTENARLRGIDVQLIKGFDKLRNPEISEPSQEPFPLPHGLLDAERTFIELRSTIERLQAQSIVGAQTEEQA